MNFDTLIAEDPCQAITVLVSVFLITFFIAGGVATIIRLKLNSKAISEAVEVVDDICKDAFCGYCKYVYVDEHNIHYCELHHKQVGKEDTCEDFDFWLLPEKPDKLTTAAED